MDMEVSALMEGGVARLQEPIKFSARVAEVVFGIRSFWTWGALVLAAIATYGTLIRRTTRLVVYGIRRGVKPVISHPHLDYDDDDASSSSDSSDDELLSCVDEEEEQEKEEEEVPEGYFGNYMQEDDGRKSRFDSWLAELARGGRGVVRAWEGVGLGFEFQEEEEEDDEEGLLSLFDLNRGDVVRSFVAGNGQVTAAGFLTSSSPATILAAVDGGSNRRAALRLWDARAPSHIPAASAEWRRSPHLLQRRRRGVLLRLAGDGELVYVAGDGAAVEATAVDLRNVRSTLPEMADADAVAVKHNSRFYP